MLHTKLHSNELRTHINRYSESKGFSVHTKYLHAHYLVLKIFFPLIAQKLPHNKPICMFYYKQKTTHRKLSKKTTWHSCSSTCEYMFDTVSLLVFTKAYASDRSFVLIKDVAYNLQLVLRYNLSLNYKV